MLDAAKVHDGLYVGAMASYAAIRAMGFDVAVCCLPALPADFAAGKVHVVHAPLHDDAFEIVNGDWERACAAAHATVQHLRAAAPWWRPWRCATSRA